MTVASNIPIDVVYLDGTDEDILTGVVGSLQDHVESQDSDDGSVGGVNARWERRKRHWTASWARDVTTVEDLFEVNGNSRGFLFISPRDRDRVATGQNIGTWDSTTRTHAQTNGVQTVFQLQVTKSTTAWAIARDVNYPLSGSVVVKLEGVVVSSGLYTVNYTTGTVTFGVAPITGKTITADFEFAWPVVFTSDEINTTQFQLGREEIRSISFAEIF